MRSWGAKNRFQLVEEQLLVVTHDLLKPMRRRLAKFAGDELLDQSIYKSQNGNTNTKGGIRSMSKGEVERKKIMLKREMKGVREYVDRLGKWRKDSERTVAEHFARLERVKQECWETDGRDWESCVVRRLGAGLDRNMGEEWKQENKEGEEGEVGDGGE